MTSRRAFIGGGCAAAFLAALPTTAEAGRRAKPAPRVTCPHSGCRHFRPVNEAPGICGLSIRGEVAYPDEELP